MRSFLKYLAGGGVLALGLILLTVPARAVTVERVVSPGGIEAWLVQDHSQPIISLDFAMRGGAASDPADKAGLARMVTGLLDEGADDLDSGAFQSAIEDLGARIDFSASQDTITGSLQTITPNRDAALDLLQSALTAPRFDAPAVERIRSSMQRTLASQAENPDAIATRILYAEAFPGHPYGRSVNGTPTTVAAISIADLKDFAAHRLGRDTLVIGIVGDITPDDLKPILDRVFGGLPAIATTTIPELTTPTRSHALLLAQKPIPQSVIRFGQPGLKRDDKDFYVALVVDNILGAGGFSSRLMNEVRVKRGLAYGINAGLACLDAAGLIIGQTATQNARTVETVALIKSEWARMQAEGPTEKELEEAKTYMTGSFALPLESTGAIASTLIGMQLDHLGIDYLDKRNSYIAAVTLDDARRVAKSLLDPSSLSFVVVGNPEGLTADREIKPGG